jgi:hypothetical protein
MVPISFAKQAKPPEERLYSRFKELEPDAVRVTRYKGGSILEEIMLQKPDKTGTHWITSVQAEELLSSRMAEIALERARMRGPNRLKKEIPSDAIYQTLSDNEKKILLMSQKEYNSFRASKGEQGTQVPIGTQVPAGAAGAAPEEPTGSS